VPNYNSLHLLGYASGIAGAANAGSGEGPIILQNSPYLSALHQQGLTLTWDKMITPNTSYPSILAEVSRMCQQLAESITALTTQKESFLVFGGDHTSAIGTWSGAAHAMRHQGQLGLIWIDAHMDSHTPETTESGNLHGMPLACLLGYGEPCLIQLGDHLPKLQPENVCLIGIRSYEEREEALLQKLNVKVFYMEEIKERGLTAVLADARERVAKNTVGYGISIDIDSMDPHDAPGTGVIEPDGIAAEDLCAALTTLANDSRRVGIEIVEFDPLRDSHYKTEKIIAQLVSALTLGKY
jgi:arginase